MCTSHTALNGACVRLCACLCQGTQTRWRHALRRQPTTRTAAPSTRAPSSGQVRGAKAHPASSSSSLLFIPPSPHRSSASSAYSTASLHRLPPPPPLPHPSTASSSLAASKQEQFRVLECPGHGLPTRENASHPQPNPNYGICFVSCSQASTTAAVTAGRQASPGPRREVTREWGDALGGVALPAQRGPAHAADEME